MSGDYIGNESRRWNFFVRGFFIFIFIEENGVYVRIIVLVVKLIRGFFCSLNNIDEMDGKFCFCFEINER